MRLCIISVFLLAGPLAARAELGAAATYLSLHAESPWAIMALSAAGNSADGSSLKNIDASSAIGLEAPMLAIAALGEDPRTYGSTDLVAALLAFYQGGQLGDPATLNDDIFGLLALHSAGAGSADAAAGVEAHIRKNQNEDGGWPFMTGGASDTNTTAAAIMALVASGASSSEAPIAAGVSYLLGAQNEDGGYPYDPKSSWGATSDSSSDAWVMMALRAAGGNVAGAKASTTEEHLRSLQAAEGYFVYQAGGSEDSFSAVTTSYAFLALSGKTLPVRTIAPPAPAPEEEEKDEAAPAPSGGGGAISGPLSIGYAPASDAVRVLGTSTIQSASSSVARATTTPVEAATTTPVEDQKEESVMPPLLFPENLGLGAEGAQVKRLQSVLIERKLLHIHTPTGWFGPQTFEAVKRYQAAAGIMPSGFVNMLTRAVLNGVVVPESLGQ